MLVVPIAKDVIETKEGTKYRVIEYTNYKEAGPAVYAKSAAKEVVLIYFFDIVSINGTKVEFQKSSKVFNALGKVERKQQLPQPDDKVVILSSKIVDDTSKHTVEVASLKLKSKSLGIHKGLFVKDTEGETFRLSQVLDLEPSLGGNSFNRDEFLQIYKEYTGV